jgi:hypothetical protein
MNFVIVAGQYTPYHFKDKIALLVTYFKSI